MEVYADTRVREVARSSETFNLLTYGLSNWKEKFTATIPIRDLNPCRAAAAYFCGAPLHVMEQTDIGYFKVMCPGYYECIGS